MKTQKKINFHSLWLKVIKEKSWAKITISQRGVTISGTQDMRAVADNLMARYKELAGKKMPFGEIIDTIETEYAALNA